jgi:hypothetical protein
VPGWTLGDKRSSSAGVLFTRNRFKMTGIDAETMGAVAIATVDAVGAE